MESYLVLARKWRPAQFSDVVGQGSIIRTLMNSIQSERIHQAYLFTGSRGIGKTSIARIFAKAVRCENTVWDGAWLKSCDQCSNCKEIAAGTSVDVIEIDGASNNGVDAVREIRENVKYLPANGRRKIYILDEVHMLTTAAFNALLKTLEEPPPHIIFIFATTEPHKIPATILSRVQKFDFRRVTPAQIDARLTYISEKEGLQVDPGSLPQISRAAEGSMRDALSLFDQVIAFSGKKISAAAVRESLGLIEGEVILGILRDVLGRDTVGLLALLDDVYQQGHDLRELMKSLIEYLHGIIVVKVGGAKSLAQNYSKQELKEVTQLSLMRELEELEMIFQVLHFGMEQLARSPQPKLILDILLIKCATAESLISLDDPSASSSAVGGGAKTPLTSTGLNSPSPSNFPSSPSPSTPKAKPSLNVVPLSGTPPTLVFAVPVSATPNLAGSGATRTWESFIAHVKKTRPLLASILEHGHCTAFPDLQNPDHAHTLVIRFQPGDAYYREQLQSPVYHEQLLLLGREYFGRTVTPRIELKAGEPDIESLASKRDREQTEREKKMRETTLNHPSIREARSLFGGEMGPIELDPAYLHGDDIG